MELLAIMSHFELSYVSCVYMCGVGMPTTTAVHNRRAYTQNNMFAGPHKKHFSI